MNFKNKLSYLHNKRRIYEKIGGQKKVSSEKKILDGGKEAIINGGKNDIVWSNLSGCAIFAR